MYKNIIVVIIICSIRLGYSVIDDDIDDDITEYP